MNITKNQLLGGTMMIRPTAMERQHGRIMRGPDHDSGTGDNNTPGNQAPGGGESKEENNTSKPLTVDAFWNGSGEEAAPSPRSGESAEKPESSSEQQQAPNLNDQIKALKLGSFMTPEVHAELAEGKSDLFQAGLQDQMQTMVRESLRMSIGVMSQVRDQIRAEIKQELQGTLGERDNNDALVKDFPSAKDPAIRKTVEPVFAQALKNTKGDRVAAVQQTKDMLRLFANATGKDIGLDLADNRDTSQALVPSNVDWADELLGR